MLRGWKSLPTLKIVRKHFSQDRSVEIQHMHGFVISCLLEAGEAPFSSLPPSIVICSHKCDVCSSYSLHSVPLH